MRRALLAVLAACGSEPGSSGPYFESPMFFDRDVASLPKAADSDQLIGALRAAGGWGNGDVFAIDFSFDVLDADASTPMRTFTPNADFYTPDCDTAPVPIPDGGDVEGESGYACTQGGDCHLLVFDHDAGKLYEMYRADVEGSAFSGGCLAVWNTHEAYGATLRGDQCTSADAAGLPIAPLLFTADEVAAGHIDHALRFTIPNDRIRPGFVRPATHSTETTGLVGAPYYGVHLRLRADYPVDSLPSEGAKVVARALQQYGMIHADGGDIVLTAQTDRRSRATWSGLLGSQDLQALTVEDFEVIDHGPAITPTNHCMR